MTGLRRALAPALLAAAALGCAFAIERSLACPIQSPPQPPRTLYQLNERVVGAKEVLEVEDDSASVRVSLHVTENVKGAPVPLIHLHDQEFVSEGAGEDEGETRSLSFSGRAIPQLKQGERYLFFLNPREEGDGYEVNDESYGTKLLTACCHPPTAYFPRPSPFGAPARPNV